MQCVKGGLWMPILGCVLAILMKNMMWTWKCHYLNLGASPIAKISNRVSFFKWKKIESLLARNKMNKGSRHGVRAKECDFFKSLEMSQWVLQQVEFAFPN
jgi:hypothetical protein